MGGEVGEDGWLRSVIPFRCGKDCLSMIMVGQSGLMWDRSICGGRKGTVLTEKGGWVR